MLLENRLKCNKEEKKEKKKKKKRGASNTRD